MKRYDCWRSKGTIRPMWDHNAGTATITCWYSLDSRYGGQDPRCEGCARYGWVAPQDEGKVEGM